MKSQRAVFSASTVLFVLCVCFGSLHAQPMPPYFIDDFEDGSATDGMPVTWIPIPDDASGTREVVAGDYVVTPTAYDSTESEVEALIFEDVSIRTQFRSMGENWVGVYARSSDLGPPNNDRSVGAVMSPTGDLYLYEILNGVLRTLGDPVTNDWDPTAQDVFLEMDVVGDNLYTTAWLDGMERPSSPQLNADISFPPVPEGGVGLFVLPLEDVVLRPVSFRWYAAVPEPDSHLVHVVGLLGLLILRQR